MKWSMKWVVFVFALGLNINSDAMAYGSVQVKYDIDGRQFAVFYRVLQHEDHTHALTPDFQKQTEESFVRRGESFCFDHQCRYVEGQTKEHQQQYVSLQHSYSGGQWPHQESLVEDDEPRNLLQQTSDALAKFLDTYAKVVQTKASYMLWDLPPDFFQLHAILLDIKINTDAGEIVSFQYSMQADSSLFPKHDVLFGLHTQRRELIGEEEIDSAYTGQKWVGPATLLLKSKSANKHMIQSQPMIFKVTLREEKKWNIFDVYAQLLEEARVKSALGLGSMIQKQAKWTNLSKQDVSLASNIHFSFDTVAKIKERTGRHFTSVYRYADPEDIERNPIFSHEDKAQLYHPTVRLEDQVEINIASRIETIAKDFLHLAQGTTLETYFYEDPDYDPQFGYQSQITFQKLKTNGVFYNDGVEHYPTVQPFYEMEIFMSSYALEQGNRTIGNLSCNIVAKEFSDRVELKVSGWCAGKEPMQTTITYDVIQGQSNMADAIYQTVLNDHDGLYVLKLMNPKKKKLSFGMATRR